MKSHIILLILLSLLLVAMPAMHTQAEPVAIKAGEILTISGAPVSNGEDHSSITVPQPGLADRLFGSFG